MMLRFSHRLKRKREEVAGQPELLLPQARVITTPINLNLCVFTHDDVNDDRIYHHEDVPVVATAHTTIADLVRQAVVHYGLQSTDDVCIVVVKKGARFPPSQLVANCNIRSGSSLTAFFWDSADAGKQFYLNHDYSRAARHLSRALSRNRCHHSHYAAYYADICLRSLDGKAHELEEAARWYIVASQSCDATIHARLAELSPEFAAKLVAAKYADLGVVKSSFVDNQDSGLLKELASALVAEWRKLPQLPAWAARTAQLLKRRS